MKKFSIIKEEERALFITEAAARLGLHPVIIEKDFWVTWTLARLFEQEPLRSGLVFKGGTSLSKVFGVINRFSEDIDLSISPVLLGHDEAFLDDAPSSSKRRKRIKEIEELCSILVKEKIQKDLENLFQKILGPPKTQESWLHYQFDETSKSPILLFSYPKSIHQINDYIASIIKIEFGSLTDQQPKGVYNVSSILANILGKEFEDFSSDVIALELERTFWEKATILHTEFHRPLEQPIRSNFSRHYSDFSSLWKNSLGRSAALREDILERVVMHKSLYFTSSWANYETARFGALRLVPPSERIKELNDDYEKMKVMFLTEPPSFEEVCKNIEEAERTINYEI